MSDYPGWALVAHLIIESAFVLRVMLRKHREPASRVAWVAVIALLPVLGILAYLFLGEVRLGRRRVSRFRQVLAELPPAPGSAADDERRLAGEVLDAFAGPFAAGESISGFRPVGGNAARLLADSNATIDALVADIDAARDHVHVVFYIWLNDRNGERVAEAIQRAAHRGVACRVLVDGLGSRGFLRSSTWQALREAGAQAVEALPVGNVLFRTLVRRVDLRNHRKIVVIDNTITYCGSQNCADPEFRVKAKYAPWVDTMVRCTGPVARQNQFLFSSDWMAETQEDLRPLLAAPVERPAAGCTAQVIGTGPNVRPSAMSEMFVALLHAARTELSMTTPYFVPDEPLLRALCAAARRQVRVRLILPARNDSRIVAGASRSYYADLLAAGVELLEFRPGLLHAKTLIVDGELTLIGSANMDRRSFELNYENNILFQDREFAAALRERQDEFAAQSRPVTLEEVENWSLPRRLMNNVLATLGPIL